MSIKRRIPIKSQQNRHIKDIVLFKYVQQFHRDSPLISFRDYVMGCEDYTPVQIGKMLAFRIMLQLFEPDDTSKEIIQKRIAFRLFQDLFKQYYQDECINFSTFGKFVKIIYPGVSTHRIGARTDSKYCYKGFRLKAEYQLMSKKLALKYEFLCHAYQKFLTKGEVNDQFYEFKDEYWLKVLDHCNVILLNLKFLLTKKNLSEMIKVWDELFNTKLIENIDTVDKKLIEEFINTVKEFKTLLEDINEDDNDEMSFDWKQFDNLLYHFIPFKIRIQADGDFVKFKVVRFCMNFIHSYKNNNHDEWLLNFNFFTTLMLKILTKTPVFANFWILKCFIDELLKFLIELHNSKILIP